MYPIKHIFKFISLLILFSPRSVPCVVDKWSLKIMSEPYHFPPLATRVWGSSMSSHFPPTVWCLLSGKVSASTLHFQPSSIPPSAWIQWPSSPERSLSISASQSSPYSRPIWNITFPMQIFFLSLTRRGSLSLSAALSLSPNDYTLWCPLIILSLFYPHPQQQILWKQKLCLFICVISTALSIILV